MFMDQILKWQATHGWSQPHLINKYLGWQPYLNSGAGFGFPLPVILTLVLSGAILAILIFILFRLIYSAPNPATRDATIAVVYILSGALSNFIDRLFFLHTIDYLFILTGFINLGDILIVSGLALYFVRLSKLKNQNS